MASLVGESLLWFDRGGPFRCELELTIRQTFFLSQALALVSVGTGRLASAVALSEAGRQSSWELASWIGSCLCGLWIVAETLLATVSCSYDETEGRFVCFGQVSSMARGRGTDDVRS
jgi:hypothetical protein